MSSSEWALQASAHEPTASANSTGSAADHERAGATKVNGIDLSGRVGLFCDDQGTFPDNAEASRLELIELPAVKNDER